MLPRSYYVLRPLLRTLLHAYARKTCYTSCRWTVHETPWGELVRKKVRLPRGFRSWWFLQMLAPEITEEVTVYRYSPDIVVETLKVKVARLDSPSMFEASRTLTRALAKDGLMEDGKDDLLERKS